MRQMQRWLKRWQAARVVRGAGGSLPFRKIWRRRYGGHGAIYRRELAGNEKGVACASRWDCYLKWQRHDSRRAAGSRSSAQATQEHGSCRIGAALPLFDDAPRVTHEERPAQHHVGIGPDQQVEGVPARADKPRLWGGSIQKHKTPQKNLVSCPPTYLRRKSAMLPCRPMAMDMRPMEPIHCSS